MAEYVLEKSTPCPKKKKSCRVCIIKLENGSLIDTNLSVRTMRVNNNKRRSYPNVFVEVHSGSQSAENVLT